MHRGTLGILAAAASFALLAGVAGAARTGEPKKAAKVSLSLVDNYGDCTATNDTTTGTLSLPACHPSVRSDTTCAFDPAKGSGSLSASVGGSDLKISVKAAGITGCEGQKLCLAATIKFTTNACTSGDPDGCTTPTMNFDGILAGVPAFCCTVAGGKCAVKTSANTAIPGAITPGKLLNVNIKDCGLQRTTGTGSPVRTFSCGLLVP